MQHSSGNPFSVRWGRFASGERMPFLVPVITGVPLQAPLFWIVALKRPSNKQPNTLANELRSLIYLFLWADARGIDLPHRFREGTLLTLTEIVDLVRFCGHFLEEAIAEVESRRSNLVVLRHRRHGDRKVQSDEQRNRLSSIHSFIEFTTADILSTLAPWPGLWDRYNAIRTECLQLIRAYRDGLSKKSRGELDLPKGLEEKALARLRQVIEPDHPDNPFQPQVRFRNYVIVRLLLDLGIRRGELCGIKVSDCLLGSSGSVTIHRRPDDPDDTRRMQAATKTVARVLSLSDRMTEVVHEWVVYYRAKIPGARRNPYLIVSSVSGQPMSMSNVNKIIEALRRKVDGLPKELTPHVLRHSWNDSFSALMDRKGVPEEREVKLRAKLMGWRNLESARFYLRRTVSRRADQVLKEMQDQVEATDRGRS
ncbi:hypothetical protein ELG67_11065 [Rhizobium leguminosarum]|uniref:tyrosine-type recombinase/integrase n=1 Tax=Rhizobium leguminosarum TaxID=384 RepID=UPI001037B72A|nr:tyrosine-type recombinase/integrase [Rhizobium leguminosarum]TBG89590.1 hypothetical protein ELG67_11065 [Rhizobium leguminosarum]